MKTRLIPKGQNGLTSRISNIYRKLNNSGWGLAYDATNAALYLAAPFTSGATLPLAMTMTGAQAGGAVADAVEHGIDLNNGIDMASAIPGFGLTEKAVKYAMKPTMKAVGKTAKVVKTAQKYAPKVEKGLEIVKTTLEPVAKHGGRKVMREVDHVFNLGKHYPTLWQLASKDAKYIPYAALVYGEDVLNHGLNMFQIGKDVEDLNDNNYEKEVNN